MVDTAAWERARAGDAAARGAVIEAYGTLVSQIVRRLSIPSTPVADQEDLVSAGMVGLIDAVDRYDPRRGVPFQAYATRRIRGAVLDELRRLDARGRAVWRQARRVRRASLEFAASTGRDATVTELSEATQLDAAKVRAALQAYACATVSLDRLLAIGVDPCALTSDLTEDATDRDDLEDVGTAVRALPAREHLVLSEYYGRSRKLREIGVQLGVSEARVSQLHTRAIEHLRRTLTIPARSPLAAQVA